MSKSNTPNRHWIDPKERIEYYLNFQPSFDLNKDHLNHYLKQNTKVRKEFRFISYNDYRYSLVNAYCRYLMPLPLIRQLRALPYYAKYRNLHSLIDFLRPFYKIPSKVDSFKFPIYYGEDRETGTLPIIRKSRKITDDRSIIYDLRSLRYNTPCIEVVKSDIDWNKKKNNVVWRGATTGQVTRERFVKKYFDKYNIGFSTVKQKPHLAQYMKQKVSISEQLKFKFIVSLQGNDLASNIRWVLLSNSVPIMPKPAWVGWTMEDKLIHNVHYLELNEDLSNLEELLEWAENNNEACQEIANNGKMYVSQFLDRNYNDKIRMMLLEEYASRINVI